MMENFNGRNNFKEKGRWKDNTKMNLKELGWTRVFWLKICTSGGLM
jgi:hypothetical protein